MKLLSLSVEHFRCIRKAGIEFAPGLNVLFGPNDLGKSSLAHAIRAALLLQHNAKEHEKFVNWSGSGEPYVELVFESEPQRIWRVKKKFGPGGSSFLDESRNGIDFTNECRGRDVDGRLREILRWGIAPPGGKRGSSGMPASFLSAALFAEQDRVDAIFEHGLAGDSDETGKKRLSEVLQAMAEDPVFRNVLSKAQERVDEAFNKTGGRKTGKNAPWTKLREAIREADKQYRQYQQDLQNTETLEAQHQQLLDRKLQQKEAVDRAEALVQGLEEGLGKQQQRQQILNRLYACSIRLSDVRGHLDKLTVAEKDQVERGQAIANLRTAEATAKSAVLDAHALVTAAADQLAQFQSEDRVRERLLKQSGLERQQANLRMEQERNQGALGRIAAIEAAAAKVRAIESQAEFLIKPIADLQNKYDANRKAVRDSEDQQRELGRIGQLLRLNAAKADLNEAERLATQVRMWREEARQKRAEAAVLQNAQPLFSLPDSAQLAELRRLSSDMRVAAANLNVGLSVTVRPKHELRLTVQRDGAQPEDYELRDSDLETSARRQIWLDIEGIAEIAFTGGAEDARQESERLERRWQIEAAPLLKLADATTLEQLAQMVDDTERRKREIQQALDVATQFEQRISDQPDWASMLEERKEHLTAVEKELGDADRGKLETAARKLGLGDAASAEKRLGILRTKHTGLIDAQNKFATELAVAQTQETGYRKELAAAREDLGRAESSVEGNWQERKREIASRQADVASELHKIHAELESLSAAEDRSVAEAQKTLEDRKRELAAAEDAHRDVAEELGKACLTQATAEGELKILRASAAMLDENAAHQAVAQIEAELQSIPAPDPPVTEQRLTEARDRLEEARTQFDEVERDAHAKRGALQQVGGDVSRQHAAEAEEQLERAKRQERETELELEAWDLLRQTLREAEQEESGHLGRLLAGPIASRFSGLTTGRYGKLALGPSLETQGIFVAGDDRDVGLLSVGTKDQLSTVLRLTIAELLKSTIVLDDQLTQSDPTKMLWLRDFLMQIAATVQVIVFTCRPVDYLSNGTGHAAVRSTELTQIIERSRRFES
jgi:DNA repair exonuclease SbcCD ATPase subunit